MVLLWIAFVSCYNGTATAKAPWCPLIIDRAVVFSSLSAKGITVSFSHLICPVLPRDTHICRPNKRSICWARCLVNDMKELWWIGKWPNSIACGDVPEDTKLLAPSKARAERFQPFRDKRQSCPLERYASSSVLLQVIHRVSNSHKVMKHTQFSVGATSCLTHWMISMELLGERAVAEYISVKA